MKEAQLTAPLSSHHTSLGLVNGFNSTLAHPASAMLSPVQSDSHPSHFRLLDLPPEVLQNVIHLLAADSAQDTFPSEPCSLQVATDWTDLVSLSLTCRWLHLLAAPIYSRRLLLSKSTPLDSPGGREELQPHGSRWSPSPEPESVMLAEQCKLLMDSYKRRLKHVTSVRYWEQDRPENMGPSTELLGLSRSLLETIPALRFLSLCETHCALTDAMLSADLVALKALSLVHLGHNALPSKPPYACIGRLRALKIHSCDASWLSLLPKITQLEELDIYCKLKDLDWFEPAQLLPKLRYLNIAGSFPPDIVIDLCDKIHAHRAKGLPFVLEEFGLLTAFNRTIFYEVLKCLAHHAELRSLRLSTLKTKTRSPGLIEAIVSAGLVNLRRLELMVVGRGGHEFSPAIVRDPKALAKLRSLHSLVYKCPQLSHESFNRVGYDPLKADAAKFFEHCSALQLVTHVPVTDCAVVHVCEARRSTRQAGAVEIDVPWTPQPSMFELRWAD